MNELIFLVLFLFFVCYSHKEKKLHRKNGKEIWKIEEWSTEKYCWALSIISILLSLISFIYKIITSKPSPKK